MIKRAQDRAEHGVREKNGNWGLNSVIQRHESGRFEHAVRIRPVLFASHPRMQSRHQRHSYRQHQERVGQSDQRAEPPVGHVPGFEDQDVQNRKNQAV